jgi:hypothetical protein
MEGQLSRRASEYGRETPPPTCAETLTLYRLVVLCWSPDIVAINTSAATEYLVQSKAKYCKKWGNFLMERRMAMLKGEKL